MVSAPSPEERRASRRAEPHVVYRLYGQDDELLYVGLAVARNLGKRLRAHRRKGWWVDVSRSATTWHPNFVEAARAEAAIVREVKPIRNLRITTRF